MNKVTTINLNGRAYQLEEAGYDALRKYLDGARAKLADNPDADEIMNDFESAIADKCDARLSSRKNVVTAAEIEEIIKAMGPVDVSGTASANGDAQHNSDATGTGTATGTNAGATGTSPKRLYRLPYREWIAGVCTGLGAYFNIDVTIIRVLFVLLVAFSHGFGVLVYILLWIVIPVARTDEERAAARGTKPFNAHDFIEQAKARAEEFRKEWETHHGKYASAPMPEKPGPDAGKSEWDKWKEDLKAWKTQLKHNMHAEKARWRAEERARHAERHHNPWNYGQNYDYVPGAGFFRFLMGLVIAALTVAWIYSIVLAVQHGTIFGYAVVAGGATHARSLAIALVFLTALYYLLVLPFKFLAKDARPTHWTHYSFFNDVVQSIFFVFAIYLVIVLGRELFPVVNEAYTTVVGYLQSMKW